MRKIKITADSSCDLLSLDLAEFKTAPMKVNTNEREFVDNGKLDLPDMLAYLESYRGRSRSSCPNTADWLEAFGDADDVFCVTITSGLSGSYNSASAAGKIYEEENEGKRVYVIDSLSAGPEVTLIVKKLETLISEGKSFDEICTLIDEYKKHTGLLFMLKSLKNFANNGRISPIIAKLIGVAGICIVGKASDEGTLAPMHKCHGERRSFVAITDELSALGYNGGKISIGHCFNDTGAETLKRFILEEYPNADIEIHKLMGLCSFYAERGGILVGFEKA